MGKKEMEAVEERIKYLQRQDKNVLVGVIICGTQRFSKTKIQYMITALKKNLK